jgi:hypothetical protein
MNFKKYVLFPLSIVMGTLFSVLVIVGLTVLSIFFFSTDLLRARP